MEAFDVENGEIVFLKNRWRADLDGIYKKGEVYVPLLLVVFSFTTRFASVNPKVMQTRMRITYSRIMNGL